MKFNCKAIPVTLHSMHFVILISCMLLISCGKTASNISGTWICDNCGFYKPLEVTIKANNKSTTMTNYLEADTFDLILFKMYGKAMSPAEYKTNKNEATDGHLTDSGIEAYEFTGNKMLKKQYLIYYKEEDILLFLPEFDKYDSIFNTRNAYKLIRKNAGRQDP